MAEATKVNGREIEKDEFDAEWRALRRKLFDLVEAVFPEGQQADAAKRQIRQATQYHWDRLCDKVGLPRNYAQQQED